MPKNLWFLTEERPKSNVIQTILATFLKDFGFVGVIRPLIIRPILRNNKFTFTYEVTGFECKKVENIYIKTVTGNSSFVDFLIFYQDSEPKAQDEPIYAIEETKTDDRESRNTGVYQRCSKFVFVDFYYPKAKKIMLYNLQVEQKEVTTDTNVFGTKMLKTLSVSIIGKKGTELEKFNPFDSIDEFIELKNKMENPRYGQPVKLLKKENKIEISAKLLKGKSLSHDPNIGMTTIMAKVLRNLGWNKEIQITNHQLPNQKSVGRKNKFILIANKIGISLENLTIPKVEINEDYWRYDNDGEKLGTIFIHLVVENFTNGKSIYENHAGSERGYFFPLSGEPIALEKYKDRTLYKAGDKKQIIEIPDLILLDPKEKEIINIEGEKYSNRNAGILQIKTFDFIEKVYIKKHYPNFKIIRTVVLFGSEETSIVEIEVGFLLNKNGQLILSVKSPKLFQEAIKNLLDFWN